MRDVKLVALSEDGSHLILAHEGTGEQFALSIDDRVRAAVVSDRARLGQLQLDIESRLRPREIQARVRSGESTELIAEAAGVPIERVLRYAGPVLAERGHVADQARRCAVRRHGSEGPGEVLDEAVDARLRGRGADRETVRWDAWRVESGKWTVSVHYTVGEREHRGLFSYDPSGRLVVPLDEPARWLAGEQVQPEHGAAEPVTTAGRGRTAERQQQRMRLAAVPTPKETAPPEEAIREEHEADRATGTGDSAATQASGTQVSAVPAQQAPADQAPIDRVQARREAAAATPSEPSARTGLTSSHSDGIEHDYSEDTLDLTELMHAADDHDQDADQPVQPELPDQDAESAPAAPATPTAPTAPINGRRVERVGVPPTSRFAPAAQQPEPAEPPAPASTAPAANEATETDSADAAQDAMPDQATPAVSHANRARSKRSRSKRAVVPSWDEILFGASGTGSGD